MRWHFLLTPGPSLHPTPEDQWGWPSPRSACLSVLSSTPIGLHGCAIPLALVAPARSVSWAPSKQKLSSSFNFLVQFLNNFLLRASALYMFTEGWREPECFQKDFLNLLPGGLQKIRVDFQMWRKLNDSFSGSRKVNYMSLSPNLQFCYEIKHHVDTVKNEKVLFLSLSILDKACLCWVCSIWRILEERKAFFTLTSSKHGSPCPY